MGSRELIVLQTLGLFIYLFLVLVQLLILAKTSQCPAHMCGTLCTPSGSKTDTSLGNSRLMLQTHLPVCVPTTAHRGNRKNILESATLMLWQGYELTISCLQQGLKEHVRKWTWVRPKLWTSWDTWQSRRGTRALGTEAEIWGLCRNEDNLLLGIPHPQHSLSLNKLWWKERLLWLSMERFPGMLDCSSGMYRLNGPIWKLTEMKREPYGHITNRISTWEDCGGQGGTSKLPLCELSMFLGWPTILGVG